jgi:F-type H+-transporting ATPase subunit a
LFIRDEIAIIEKNIINILGLRATFGVLFFWHTEFFKMTAILAPIVMVFRKPFSLIKFVYTQTFFAGHIVLMSIIGLMFIFKSWLGSTLSFGLSFALSILRYWLHSYRLIFSHCYQRFILVLQ